MKPISRIPLQDGALAWRLQIPQHARTGAWMDHGWGRRERGAWGLAVAETWPVCCPPSDSKAAKAESNRGNAGSSREPFIDDGLMQCCLTNFPMLLRPLANFPRTRRDLPLSWAAGTMILVRVHHWVEAWIRGVGEVWWE